MSAPENDLYVGYLPVPRRHRRALRLLVPTILWGLCALAALIGIALAPAGDAVWDSDTTRIQGTLIVDPYPAVFHEDNGAYTTTFLVESGKHGARESLRADPGRPVTVEGFLLHRGRRNVLELLPGEAGVIAQGSTGFVRRLMPTDLGEATLRGEIVDYKCFLGAMRPGHGMTHRACATLCVSGGIPPVLVTTDHAGRHAYYVLRTPEHKPMNESVLPLVGVPVEARGRVVREGDVLYLETTGPAIRAL